MWHDNDQISEIYNVTEDGGALFPYTCPLCSMKAAHVYIHRHNENHGSIWTWCSVCGASSHMSGRIPDWWQNPDFIDEDMLCSDPEYLDSLSDKIDSWINNLPRTENTCSDDSFVTEDKFHVIFKEQLQGIPAGSTGILIIRDDFETQTIQFVHDDGKIVDVRVSPEEILRLIKVCD